MKRSGSISGVLFLALVLFAGTSLAGRTRPPHNRAAPKIAGAAVTGQTPSALRGRWSNRPTAFRRWGIDEDLLRAVAVIESTWHQSTWGDRCSGGDPTIGSFSVMQIKNKNCDGSLLWGGMPDVQQSTALAVDLYAARLRACYNGDFYDGGSWLYNGQTVRQIAAAHGWPYVLWGCVGSWYSGSWYDAGAVTYIDHVQTALAQRTWLGY